MLIGSQRTIKFTGPEDRIARVNNRVNDRVNVHMDDRNDGDESEWCLERGRTDCENAIVHIREEI